MSKGNLVGSYWLVRVVFLRCLAILYAVAFLVAFNQNESLLGEDGLTPAILYVKQRPPDRSDLEMLLVQPTLFWFISPTTQNLNIFSLLGLFISILIIILGSANTILLFALWALYFSIVSIGQTWYSFGWESQLLEIGFLAMFMVPILSLRRYPKYTATPFVAIWGYRWLLFRIMIGAGMIKIRGDACWRDLTCMNYFYQTQPNPNPMSIYFHNNFELFHRFETLSNHLIELIFPFLLLIPHRHVCFAGGVVQIIFQFVLISSGNLSFLNWLTALPAIMCMDDQFLSRLFDEDEQQLAIQAQLSYDQVIIEATKKSGSFINRFRSFGYIIISLRRLINLIMTAIILYLSYPVVMNILSPNQQMNASFHPFRIVNTYGAFGSVTKVRNEVILQGTDAMRLDEKTAWRDFEFACKPGDINRRPCVISPYHIRIDWLMWFAAFQSYQHCPWIVHLADKLLDNNNITDQILAVNGNPFKNHTVTLSNMPHRHAGTSGSKKKEPVLETIRFIRAELYEYRYASLLPLSTEDRTQKMREGWELGRWWYRKHVGNYMPAIDKNNYSVKQFLQTHRLLIR